MRKFIMALIAIVIASGCSGGGEYKEAEDIITLAYLDQVNPNGSGGPVSCRHKEIESKQFILCEFENHGYRHRGLWEVQKDGSKFVFYALNGKALTALERLRSYPDFRTHPQPQMIDISAALDVFDGKSKSVIRTDVVAASQNLTEMERNTYCAYYKEKSQLTIEANKLFSDPISEDRRNWIEPKILALQKKYFSDNGLEYRSVFAKVLEAQAQCN